MQSESSAPSGGRTLTMEATAYSIEEGRTTTASGISLLDNPMVIAVDPSVIPLGSRVYVEGYGEAIAADTGGAIVGNIIDIHLPTIAKCMEWGRRTVQVTVY